MTKFIFTDFNQCNPNPCNGYPCVDKLMDTNANAKMATLVTFVKLSLIIAKTVHVKTMEHARTQQKVIHVRAKKVIKEIDVKLK